MAWIKFCGGKHKIQDIRKRFADACSALRYVKQCCWDEWFQEFAPREFVERKPIIQSGERPQEIIDIQRKVYMGALEHALELTIELAERLLQEAYKKKFVDIQKPSLCSVYDLINVAKEVMEFVEKHFDEIIQTLKRDPCCK